MRAAVIVGFGGALGASARWTIGEIMPVDPGTFPWATLVVNLVGCVAVGVAARRIVRGSELWLGAVVGVLGGLTTYSTFAIETRSLVDAERPALALAYVAVSVVGGVAGAELARNDRGGGS